MPVFFGVCGVSPPGNLMGIVILLLLVLPIAGQLPKTGKGGWALSMWENAPCV